MADPHLTIDLDKIEHNARTVVGLCRDHGIDVTGVTKGVCGNVEVAKAMLRGGVTSIGDSRLENIRRMKSAGIQTSYLLLRLPALSGAGEVAELVDRSLNSELSVLAALSAAAQRLDRVHEVVLMVDLGDLREGLTPHEVGPFVREAGAFPGIRIIGLGTNLACFGGVVPSQDNMSRLVRCASEVERILDLELKWISAANSSGLELIASGRMPARVNHARIGEAILLGRESAYRRPWPGTFQDAFRLAAEVLELKTKPSAPVGERSEDAFGRRPDFIDRGEVERALLNVGREDVNVEGLTPVDPRFTILGGSSGYLVVDTGEAAGTVRVGDEISFLPNYAAMLAAMTSEYVKKRFGKDGVCAPATS